MLLIYKSSLLIKTSNNFSNIMIYDYLFYFFRLIPQGSSAQVVLLGQTKMKKGIIYGHTKLKNSCMSAPIPS